MLHFKDKRLIKFGEHIKILRQKQGLSIDDVAANCSISRKDLHSIEEGNRNFAFTTLLDLALGLGVSPSLLMKIDFDN